MDWGAAGNGGPGPEVRTVTAGMLESGKGIFLPKSLIAGSLR